MNFRSVILGSLTLLMMYSFSGTVMAQDKIVFIDSYRIRAEYKEFLDAQAQFNKEVEAWNAEVEAGQRMIDSLESLLAKQALILSDAKRKERETEIETKKAVWQKTANEIFGPEGRAEKRNQELTKPLFEKINTVLEKIALQEGYAMILDSISGNLAYARKELDITSRVLEELEKTQ